MPQNPKLAAAAAFFAVLAGSPLYAADALDLDCVEVAKALGPLPVAFVEIPNEGWQHAPDEARLVCSWYTEAADKAIRGERLTGEDYADLGTLTAQVVVYDNPLDRRGAAMLNAAYDLSAGLAPEGAWLFSLTGLDLAAPLGMMAPELLQAGIGVSVAYAKGFAISGGTDAPFTVGWSVEAAARIMAKAEKQR